MTPEEDLKKLVQNISSRIKQKASLENSKLEIKKQWPDISSNANDKDLNESKIVRQIASIANTYGPIGYLIYGIDEANGDLLNAPISQSGLRDKSQLYDLIVKMVEKPVTFTSHEIEIEPGLVVTVIEIPPSPDKPHVIGRYKTDKQQIQNYIPVKKDSGIFAASRSDIDLMYYDNANQVPEFGINIFASKELYTMPTGGTYSVIFTSIIENFGRRPIALNHGELWFKEFREVNFGEPLLFTLNRYNDGRGLKYINEDPIIVARNTAVVVKGTYSTTYTIQSAGQLANFKLKVLFKDIFTNSYTSADIHLTEGRGH